MFTPLVYEVVVGIIDQLQDDIQALRNCALTCRQFRPRSRFHVLTRIRLNRKDQLESLYELLDRESFLGGFIRSVAISLLDVVPLPLLARLPNLSHLRLIGVNPEINPPRNISLHSSTLLCCRQFGTRIRTLSLHHVYFANTMAFTRLLLALQNIRCISCHSVYIGAGGEGGPLDLVKRRLLDQMGLTELIVCSIHSSSVLSR